MSLEEYVDWIDYLFDDWDQNDKKQPILEIPTPKIIKQKQWHPILKEIRYWFKFCVEVIRSFIICMIIPTTIIIALYLLYRILL